MVQSEGSNQNRLEQSGRLSSKPVLRLDMSGFGARLVKEGHWFYKLLSSRYEIQITSKPDILIYAPLGKDYKAYDCIRVCYIQENWRPNFAECDYALCFDYSSHGGRSIRMPYYVYNLNGDSSSLIRKTEGTAKIESVLNRKFCSFVATNGKGKKRNRFADLLGQYKDIHYGGRYRNNVGGRVKDKLSFISQYKFNVAFENSSYPGYTTEKIVEAFQAGTIPIYWGNPKIVEEFNPRSFINCHEFRTMQEVVERVIEIDRNDDLFLEYLNQPCFHDNVPNEYFNLSTYFSFFDEIISKIDKQVPVARGFRRHFTFRKQKRKIDFLRNRLSNYLK